MRTSRSFATASAMLFALVPSLAFSQAAARNLDELRLKVKVGDTIYVTDQSGREQPGRIIDLSPTALVLASDLDNRWNNFPLHATFVPFLHEAIEYLSSHSTPGAGYLIGQVGADVREPGIVAMAAAGVPSATRRVAINVDPREADSARLSVDEFETAIVRVGDDVAPAVRVERRDEENRQHLWQYLMAAMLMLLVAEGVVAARTA